MCRDLSSRCLEIVSINLGIVGPLFWQIFEHENSCHRADWNASAAVNALLWVLYRAAALRRSFCSLVLWPAVIIAIFSRVDAINRADIYASGIFGSYARFGYDVCHFSLTSPFLSRLLCFFMARISYRRCSFSALLICKSLMRFSLLRRYSD